MSSFDQALLLLSARCKRVEEDLGIVVDFVGLRHGDQAQKFIRFDGRFVPEQEVFAQKPGPEVVLENDKVFAPPVKVMDDFSVKGQIEYWRASVPNVSRPDLENLLAGTLKTDAEQEEAKAELDKIFAPPIELPFAEDNLQPMGFTGDDIVAPEEEASAPDKKKKK